MRELNSDYGYKEAADYYVSTLRKIGLIPRFDFTVPEEVFLEMCKAANVDPNHPKIGWKGKGNDWNPVDSDAYYSMWCDYGMTDPATGKWSPHRPVGFINERGEREFRLPDNVVEIAKEGMERYSSRRDVESSRTNEAVLEYVKRSIADHRMDADKAKEILQRYGIDMEGEVEGKNDGVRFSISPEEKEVQQKAIDGRYIGRAPNGKVSNLKERRQWLQVRTEGFKNFFGEWETAALYKMAQDAIATKKHVGTYRFAPSDRLKTKLEGLAGHPVERVVIDAGHIVHTDKKHGKNEALRGQIDITAEDIALIPYYMNNYDDIVPNPKYDQPTGRAFDVYKRINGVAVVGTIEVGKDGVAIATEFKTKTAGVQMLKAAPGLNALDVSARAKIALLWKKR
ncbi:MAG: hypothetical protein J5548_06080 [Prevotella sp.]|nr:hypothetical protein [Prevotella sp.]